MTVGPVAARVIEQINLGMFDTDWGFEIAEAFTSRSISYVLSGAAGKLSGTAYRGDCAQVAVERDSLIPSPVRDFRMGRNRRAGAL